MPDSSTNFCAEPISQRVSTTEIYAEHSPPPLPAAQKPFAMQQRCTSFSGYTMPADPGAFHDQERATGAARNPSVCITTETHPRSANPSDFARCFPWTCDAADARRGHAFVRRCALLSAQPLLARDRLQHPACAMARLLAA